MEEKGKGRKDINTAYLCVKFSKKLKILKFLLTHPNYRFWQQN